MFITSYFKTRFISKQKFTNYVSHVVLTKSFLFDNLPDLEVFSSGFPRIEVHDENGFEEYSHAGKQFNSSIRYHI